MSAIVERIVRGSGKEGLLAFLLETVRRFAPRRWRASTMIPKAAMALF
jgi:hypothetical protein